jgi:hypothetical protein
VTRNSSAAASLIDEETNSALLIAPNGALNTSELFRLVGDNFINNLPLLSHIWSETIVGSGTITTPDGELNLTTNATSNSSVRLETVRRARFITATFNIAHLAISTPSYTNTNVIRRWGCYDPQSVAGGTDGVYWENNGGSYSVVRVKNGVIAESVPEASFSEVASNTLVKNNNIAIYEILYNAGTIFFFQNRKLMHRMSSLASAAYGTPHLKVGLECTNINGNTTSNSLVSRGASINRIGASTAIPQSFHIAASGTYTIKNTPGRLHRVILGDKGVGASTMTIYNNTAASGTVIAQIDSTDVQGDMEIQAEFDIGLVITVGGASVSLTVIYD